MSIDKSLVQRIPLIQEEWMPNLRRLVKDTYSPRWNHKCGDRLQQEDLKWVQEYANELEKDRQNYHKNIQSLLDSRLKYLKQQSDWFNQRIGGYSIKDLEMIPVMGRRHLAEHLEEIIPRDADLEGLVINPSSGTTGEALLNPNHPRAVGCYDALIQYALKRHGVDVSYDHNTIAAVQLCYQKNTITYYTVHSYLKGAGFAKINIHPDEWSHADDANKYLHSLQPVFLSGDPVAFSYAMESAIDYQPRALLSTALALNPVLRQKLEQHFNCPVIDMYSLNESGPVFYSCPLHADRYHVLPHDIYVELLDEQDQIVSAGQSGYITISGGRNPYIPLLRYKTEDKAVSLSEGCDCGEYSPGFTHLEGRQTILYRGPEATVVNPVDISRILKVYPIVIFQFRQYNNVQYELKLFSPALTDTECREIDDKIQNLLGGKVDLKITLIEDYPLEKWLPFIKMEN